MNVNPRITTYFDGDSRGLDRAVDRSESVLKRYAKTSKQTTAANDSFANSMRGAAQGVAAIDGPLGGVASRLTAVNSIVNSSTLAWTALGTGVAGATFLLGAAVNEFSQVEQQQLKIASVVRATGSAAGFTAQQLDEMARQLARDTLASPEGIRNAITTMLTFRSVSGEAFSRAITLSQDLAATMGGDTRSAALQLGKALEDPAAGLTALKRSGVSFADSEKDLIQSLYDAGDAAAAQGLILDKLAGQVAGSGAAEGAGLAGKVDLLSQEWGEFLEALNETSGASNAAGSFLDGLTRRLDNLSKVINPDERLQVNKLHDEYVSLGEQIQKIDNAGFRRFSGAANRRNSLAERREEVAQEIAQLQEQEKQRVIAEQKLQEEADQKRDAAQSILRDQQLAAKAKREQVERDRELVSRQRHDDRVISLQQKRFERLQDAALSANDQDRELLIVRYDRQRQALDDQYNLLAERGLLTQQLEEQFRVARENAEAAHVGRMRALYESDLNDSTKDPRIEKEVTFTQALAREFGIRTDVHNAHVQGTIEQENRKNRETSRFFSEGLDDAAQKSKKWYKFQQGINIYEALQDTYAAAVGAYNSLASIPYVGPALGAAAAGAAIAFGKARVDQIRNQPMPSYMGGGFTGSGPRVGGVDGRGGFHAVVHPDEFVFDTKANNASLMPTIIINNNGPGEAETRYDQQKNEVVIEIAVREAEKNFVSQMRSGGVMSDAISNTFKTRRYASR